jgi:hypothetical protein
LNDSTPWPVDALVITEQQEIPVNPTAIEFWFEFGSNYSYLGEYCRRIMLANFVADQDINSAACVSEVLEQLGLRAREIIDEVRRCSGGMTVSMTRWLTVVPRAFAERG